MNLSQLKLELVEDAREAYKFASVRVSILLSALAAYIAACPDAVAQLWASIPADIRADLPPWVRAAFTFAIIASTLIAARVLRKRTDAQPNAAVGHEAE